MASIDSLCAASLTPGGFLMCSTASPKELNFTPWNLLGRMPLDHCRAAMGCIWPPLPEDISTTNPGRLSVSAPSP